MTRLREELSPGFETMLLDAHRATGPSAEAKQRARAAAMGALGVAATAGVGATIGAATTKAAAATRLAPLQLLSLGAVLGGLAVGGAVHFAHLRFDGHHEPNQSDGRSAVAAGATLGGNAPVAAVTAAPGAGDSAASLSTEKSLAGETLAIERAPRGRPASMAETTTTAMLPTPEDTAAEKATNTASAEVERADLMAEVQALDRIRRAIAVGRFDGAIDELDAYERSHPRGVLQLEAEVLRIEALAGSGQRLAAAGLARRYLTAHPDGPYRARLERLTGE